MQIVCIDSACPELTWLAARETVALMKSATEILFFTDRPTWEWGCQGAATALPCMIQHIQTGCLNAEHALRCLWYEVPKHLTGSHFLRVEWDGWATDPEAWTDEFLEYDYIGAPWWYGAGNRNVGNGGFSLRSKLLADVLDQNRDDFPFQLPEDETIGRFYRARLEKEYGIRFAPDHLAYRFSREWTGWDRPGRSLGMHGIWNWPRVLTVPEMGRRMALFNDYVMTRQEYPRFLNGISWALEGRR